MPKKLIINEEHMSIELKVTIKDDERKLTKDFIIYENVTLIESDPIVKKCIDETLMEFKGEPEDIKVKATLVLK